MRTPPYMKESGMTTAMDPTVEDLTEVTETAPTAESLAEVTSGDASAKRREAIEAAREAKYKKLYEGQHYTVTAVVKLTDGTKFITPFGNRGTNGFQLTNDDPSAEGDNAKHIVGASVLKRAAAEWNAVELPTTPRKRRTAEQKAADDAERETLKAARKSERDSARAEKEQAKAAEKARLKAEADAAVERAIATQREKDAARPAAPVPAFSDGDDFAPVEEVDEIAVQSSSDELDELLANG